jgi:nicotinamidase-related amidase
MPFTREARSVLVIVDMVVDSLTGFYPVQNADEVIRNAVRVREACYTAGIPVVQLQHLASADGRTAMLNEPRLADGVTPAASVPGTPGFEIVPQLAPAGRDIVVTKHRWQGFFATELQSVLRKLGAEQLVWIGTFTDCCLSLSVFESYAHDYPSALVLDAAGCDNEFTHKTAVLTMANWIFDLNVFTTESFVRWASGDDDAPAWRAQRPNQLAFDSGEAVEARYSELLAAASSPVPST